MKQVILALTKKKRLYQILKGEKIQDKLGRKIHVSPVQSRLS